jgi:N-acetyl-gamma-glutamyl-phosphate reductase
VEVQFTPHLAPFNRGILATCYVKGDAHAIHAALTAAYNAEVFVEVLPFGTAPSTHDVRGTNYCHIGVVADRRTGRAQVVAALDNLCKGSSGQAIQNANLMLGLDETAGLMGVGVFP